MSDTSSDTLSDVTDIVPNPPIHPRSEAKSHTRVADVEQWLETAADNNGEPMEVDSDSPDKRSSSPPAPIERSALRLLPVRRPIQPPPKTSQERVAQLLAENSILLDNNSAVILPVEDLGESMKAPAWRLTPPLEPNAPEIILPLREGEQVDLDEWFDIAKFCEDGHMEEPIAEVVEAVPEASQQPEDAQMEEFIADAIKGVPEISQQAGDEDAIQGIETNRRHDADQLEARVHAGFEDQMASEYFESVENDAYDHSIHPAASYPDPDQLMQSIETDDDYDGWQPAFDRDTAEEVIETGTNYDDVQLPADDPLNSAQDVKQLERAESKDLSSKPRCKRCRKSKKGCDRQRPCQRCKDAGLGADQFVSEDEGKGRKGRGGRHIGGSVNNIRVQQEVDPDLVKTAVNNFIQSIRRLKRSNPFQEPREQADEQEKGGQDSSKQYRAVRRHTQEQEEAFPEFARAVEERALQIDPNNYRLPGEARPERARAPLQLQPAIWTMPERVAPGVELHGGGQFSQDAIQNGMQPTEFFPAVMRGDFDDVLDENCGDELIDAYPFAELLRLLPMDDPFVVPPLIDEPDRDRRFALSMDDPFVDPPPMTDDPDRTDSDGGSDHGGNQDMGSSPPARFQHPPSGENSGEELFEHREYTNSNQDMGCSPPAAFKSALLAEEDKGQLSSDIDSSPPAGFQRSSLVDEVRENLSRDIGSSPLAALQPPSLFVEAGEEYNEHGCFTNDELIAAGQDFLKRRAAVITGSSPPDGAFDVTQFDNILGKDVQTWLAHKHDMWLEREHKPASPLRPPSSASIQEPLELDPDLLGEDLTLEQERESASYTAAITDSGLLFIERSFPRSLSRSISPLKDHPTDYELNNDEFNNLLENFDFKIELAPSGASISADLVQAEVSISEVHMGSDNYMAVEGSPFAEPLPPAEETVVSETEIQVGPSGQIVNYAQASLGAGCSHSTEDLDIEMALDVSNSSDREASPLSKKTTVLDIERHIVSSPEKTSPSVDAYKFSSTVCVGPDMPENLNSSPPKVVEASAQGTVMSEPDLPKQSMPATFDDIQSSPAGTIGVQTSAISFKTAVKTLSDGEQDMDLVDSDDEVDMIQTSPIQPPLVVRSSAPVPAPAPAPGPVLALAPIAKAAIKSGPLLSTYKKEPYRQKSTATVFQRVEQRGLEPGKSHHSLQGPTEGSHYSFGDFYGNRSRPIQAPTMIVPPQNPFAMILRRGSSYSQFETTQASQRPRGNSAHRNMNNGFSPQIQSPMPQYPNSSLEPHGYTAMSPVDASNYAHMRAGGQLRGRGHGTRGDRDRGQRGRGGSMTSGNPTYQKYGDRPQQINPNTMPRGSNHTANDFSQGFNTLVSQTQDDSHSHSLSQDDSPTPKSRLPPRPGTWNNRAARRPKGTQREQPSQSLGQIPPPPATSAGSFPDAPMTFSSQLPLKPPSKSSSGYKSSLTKTISPQKSIGELIVLAFANQGSYQKALATLDDAKQKEGVEGVEISEELDHQHGQTVKVTGPLCSGVRAWVIALVPYGRQIESRIY